MRNLRRNADFFEEVKRVPNLDNLELDKITDIISLMEHAFHKGTMAGINTAYDYIESTKEELKEIKNEKQTKSQ